MENLSGTNGAKIILPNPTWYDLMSSYFKNSSQLVLFITSYLVADTCNLGKDKSLLLYYKSRGKNSWRVFFPKVFLSISITIIGVLNGGIFALYTTWVFFRDINFEYITLAIFFQLLGFILSMTISATIAIWTNSAFLAALIVEAFVFLGGALKNVKFIGDWSPTSLLFPNEVLKKGTDYIDANPSILLSIVLFVACILFIYHKPLHFKQNKSKL